MTGDRRVRRERCADGRWTKPESQAGPRKLGWAKEGRRDRRDRRDIQERQERQERHTGEKGEKGEERRRGGGSGTRALP